MAPDRLDSIVLKMSNIEQFPSVERWHYAVVKTKELTPKQILSVQCSTCGAAVGEGCELHTGALRTESHRDRKLSASEAAEKTSKARGKRWSTLRSLGIARTCLAPD
jgi:hypothetical protein